MTPKQQDNSNITTQQPQNKLKCDIISKQDFVDLLNWLKVQDDRFTKLCGIMETLSPGNYVNFWPHLEYQSRIIKMLDSMFGFQTSQDSMISYFVTDLDFGAKAGEQPLTYNGKEVKLSTPEELYDFLIESCLKQN